MPPLRRKTKQNSPDVQGILTFDSSITTVSTGNAFADLLLGNIASYKQWNAQAKYYNRYKILEPYFQDDWRVTKRLTLNLGLRVSLFGTYRERYQQAFNFEPSAFNTADAPTLDASGRRTDGSLTPGAAIRSTVSCSAAGLGGHCDSATRLPDRHRRRHLRTLAASRDISSIPLLALASPGILRVTARWPFAVATAFSSNTPTATKATRNRSKVQRHSC